MTFHIAHVGHKKILISSLNFRYICEPLSLSIQHLIYANLNLVLQDLLYHRFHICIVYSPYGYIFIDIAQIKYMCICAYTNYLNLGIKIISVVFLKSEYVYFCPLVVILRNVFIIEMTPVIYVWKCSNL